MKSRQYIVSFLSIWGIIIVYIHTFRLDDELAIGSGKVSTTLLFDDTAVDSEPAQLLRGYFSVFSISGSRLCIYSVNCLEESLNVFILIFHQILVGVYLH